VLAHFFRFVCVCIGGGREGGLRESVHFFFICHDQILAIRSSFLVLHLFLLWFVFLCSGSKGEKEGTEKDSEGIIFGFVVCLRVYFEFLNSLLGPPLKSKKKKRIKSREPQ
jgi:hypothetical protein